ncbi:hypothetical protein BJY59DRAFT_62330 [Rhodotorula toruloides]
MSSALYDAALCSVDFAQLLPGLFNRDDNQHRTPSPPRRAKDATPHRAPKTTPHDHTATATRSEDTGAGLMARKKTRVVEQTTRRISRRRRTTRMNDDRSPTPDSRNNKSTSGALPATTTSWMSLPRRTSNTLTRLDSTPTSQSRTSPPSGQRTQHRSTRLSSRLRSYPRTRPLSCPSLRTSLLRHTTTPRTRSTRATTPHSLTRASSGLTSLPRPIHQKCPTPSRNQTGEEGTVTPVCYGAQNSTPPLFASWTPTTRVSAVDPYPVWWWTKRGESC